MDHAVEVREAGPKGRGVFALRDFGPGDIVLRFERGRVVHADELDSLTACEREHLGELTADTCQILPAPRRYVNHACAPNAISSDTELRAWRAICAGDEITIDYRLNALDDWEMTCACLGPDRLHVVVGSFFALPDEVQRAYLPHAPAFVRDEYRRRRDAS